MCLDRRQAECMSVCIFVFCACMRVTSFRKPTAKKRLHASLGKAPIITQKPPIDSGCL